jgi:tRNA dimethylallyltransferase
MDINIQEGKNLIVVCGATAVGKTAHAIDLAKTYNTEIISADSRQFYREMSIGTAKPSATELAAVPHHFINNLSIQDSYTAGEYEREALAVLDELFKSRDVVVMVGGSGLFIRAVCEGFDSFDKKVDTTDDIVERVRAMSIEQMQQALSKLDAAYYATVDKQNPRRLTRALEVIYSTGKKYSEQRTGVKAIRPFHIHRVNMELPRAQLYERINTRVDAMLEAGLWAEAEALYIHRHLQPLKTVGYQEIFECIDGTISRERAIELIKQNTRNYAKRQITWFGKTV